MFEQDKHSISKSIPFGDNSKDLWNTLSIWLQAVYTSNVDLDRTEFHMVTNKVIDQGLVKLISGATSQTEVENCVNELRRIASGTPQGVRRYVDSVCSYDDVQLGNLMKKIVLSDASNNSFGAGLKEEIKSLLLITDELPLDEIYESLLGWIHNVAMNCWRNDQPAWINRDNFALHYQKVLSKFKLRAFIETDQLLIPLSIVDQSEQTRELFVKQLSVLALNDDELTDCIEDYLRCKYERTRLSIEGNVTKEEMERFDRNLLDRWKVIFAKYNRKYRRERPFSNDAEIFASDVGFETLMESLEHREPLANQPTEQYYLTRGSYHRLANRRELELGWHPEYKALFDRGENI